MVRAKTPAARNPDMLIAREGEEIVCPKGTVCGRITHDANDQITDGDFTAREFSSSPAEQRYLCACCGRPVAVREPVRWRGSSPPGVGPVMPQADQILSGTKAFQAPILMYSLGQLATSFGGFFATCTAMYHGRFALDHAATIGARGRISRPHLHHSA
jgi:hypothetical protein